MKLTYSEYCFSDKIEIDNKIADIEMVKNANKAILEKFNTNESATQLFRDLLFIYGEFEDFKECDQCGGHDTIVHLEI